MKYGMVGKMILFLLGMFVGWIYAHNIIATECEKLGKFYVGNKVFTCISVEHKHKKEE
jgi:hypothetical protein